MLSYKLDNMKDFSDLENIIVDYFKKGIDYTFDYFNNISNIEDFRDKLIDYVSPSFNLKENIILLKIDNLELKRLLLAFGCVETIQEDIVFDKQFYVVEYLYVAYSEYLNCRGVLQWVMV